MLATNPAPAHHPSSSETHPCRLGLLSLAGQLPLVALQVPIIALCFVVSSGLDSLAARHL